MKIYDAAKIRNIAVAGHGGDGKTTLIESFLFNTNSIERKGRVEDGNTTTDFDPEEIRRGFSASSYFMPMIFSTFSIPFHTSSIKPWGSWQLLL